MEKIILTMIFSLVMNGAGAGTTPTDKWKKLDGDFVVTCYHQNEDEYGYRTCQPGVYSSSGETVAVDKDVIPLNSKIKVVFKDGTTRFYKAVDVGGMINGNHIDVFFNYPREERWTGAKVYVERRK